MQDQLQEAVRLTKERIHYYETEIRKEREFLTRLITSTPKQSSSRSSTDNWLEVFKLLAKKPTTHQRVIDFIDDNSIPLSRGAVRVGLNYKTKRGLLKRDKDGFYSATAAGQEYLSKATS